MSSLSQRVLIVTGAGRGIGRAEALAFASRGARLVLNDLGCDSEGGGADASVIEDVASEARALGAEVVTDASDVSAEGAIERLVEVARTRFGRLDAFVHAAGIARDASVLKTSMDDLDRVFAVHVRSSFEVVRVVAQALTSAREGGAILLHASPTAFFGAARQAVSAASAAALVALCRSSAVELRKHGIRVNALAPTARTRLTEETPLFKGIRPDSMTPEHVAAVAAFLVSDAAAEVHGEVVGVAGNRVYLLTSRETTGAFLEGSVPSPDDVARSWGTIVRG